MKARNTDEYIASFPEPVRMKLEEMRSIIRKAAPNAEEVISYSMPAYRQHGILVYFAGYERHIGFYPTGAGMEAFVHEMSDYKTSKGAVQFPLDKPLPKTLITKIVKFRMSQDKPKTKK